jgi:hypothetical protein
LTLVAQNQDEKERWYEEFKSAGRERKADENTTKKKTARKESIASVNGKEVGENAKKRNIADIKDSMSHEEGIECENEYEICKKRIISEKYLYSKLPSQSTVAQNESDNDYYYGNSNNSWRNSGAYSRNEVPMRPGHESESIDSGDDDAFDKSCEKAKLMRNRKLLAVPDVLVSDYEKERLANIERNKRMLEALGLAGVCIFFIF